MPWTTSGLTWANNKQKQPEPAKPLVQQNQQGIQDSSVLSQQSKPTQQSGQSIQSASQEHSGLQKEPESIQHSDLSTNTIILIVVCSLICVIVLNYISYY